MTTREDDFEFDFFDEPDEETVTQRRRPVRDEPGPKRGPRRPRGPVGPPTGLTPILRLVGLIAAATYGDQFQMVLALAGALFLGMGLLLAALFVVVIFWDTHRLAALGAVTFLYLGIAAIAFARLREKVRTSPPPFEATIRELAADRDLIRGQRE